MKLLFVEDFRLCVLRGEDAAVDVSALVRDIPQTGPHDLINGLIARFDIALQPAAVAYASPLKVFEYMAAGRAIVAPDQPNLREALEHERTALLFDPARPGAFWAAVERLAQDAGLRARLGAAARREVEERDLTWAGNARRVAAIAQEEAARRGQAA